MCFRKLSRVICFTECSPGLYSVNQDVRGHLQQTNYPFSCDSFRQRVVNIRKLINLKLSLGTSKMVAYANKIYAYF